MSHFDLPNLLKEIEELKAQTQAEDFWQDVDNAQKVSRRLKHSETKLEHYNKLCESVDGVEEILDLAADDESMLEEAAAEIGGGTGVGRQVAGGHAPHVHPAGDGGNPGMAPMQHIMEGIRE